MFDVGDNRGSNNATVKRKKSKGMDSDTKKILIIFITVFVIIFLIVYIFIRKDGDNYNEIKADKSKYLIYTKYEKTNTNYPKHVPYLNIKGDAIQQVNKDIDLFANDFKKVDRCILLYEYDISGVILSVVLKAVNHNVEFAPEVYFRSYNINLSTLEVISDDALLNFFGTNEENVAGLIENKFRYFHQEIVKEDFYKADECNYECFLNYRNVQNYMDNVSYYVKNGDLIAYKPFVFFSIYGEEDYFEDKDFEFMIVQTDKNNSK